MHFPYPLYSDGDGLSQRQCPTWTAHLVSTSRIVYKVYRFSQMFINTNISQIVFQELSFKFRLCHRADL